jgi:hypothetical protein
MDQRRCSLTSSATEPRAGTRVAPHALGRGITGDLAADDIRGWIADMGIALLD